MRAMLGPVARAVSEVQALMAAPSAISLTPTARTAALVEPVDRADWPSMVVEMVMAVQADVVVSAVAAIPDRQRQDKQVVGVVWLETAEKAVEAVPRALAPRLATVVGAVPAVGVELVARAAAIPVQKVLRVVRVVLAARQVSVV